MAKQVPAKTEPRTLITADRIAKIRAIDTTLRDGHAELAQYEAADDQTVRAFVQASLMQAIRDLLTPDMLKDLKQLMGSDMGFLTDKDRAQKGDDGKWRVIPYPDEVIRDCVIVALMKGLRLVGNEFNILAGRMYPTKYGMGRLLAEIPGFGDLDMQIGVPQVPVGGKRWVVPARATWNFKGQRFEIDRESDPKWYITLPLHDTDKPATVIGKAESQLLRMIYKRLTQSNLFDAETEAESVESPEHPRIAEAETPARVDEHLKAATSKGDVIERAATLRQLVPGNDAMLAYIDEQAEREIESRMGQSEAPPCHGHPIESGLHQWDGGTCTLCGLARPEFDRSPKGGAK